MAASPPVPAASCASEAHDGPRFSRWLRNLPTANVTETKVQSIGPETRGKKVAGGTRCDEDAACSDAGRDRARLAAGDCRSDLAIVAHRCGAPGHGGPR